MTTREAKEILLLVRPGIGDEADPQVAAALELAQRDPELQAWFQQHCAFNAALRKKFAELPVPRTLKGDILLGPKVVRGPAHWWSRRAALAIAACLVLLAIVGALWRSSQPRLDYPNCRARMVGTLQREYPMEITTNDMQPIRAHLAERGAPADYTVPNGLATTALTGAGVLSWQGEPVSMVCFDRGNKDMVFMLVFYKKQFRQPPPPLPQLELVKQLATASWSSGNKVYLLVASGNLDSLRPYLPEGAAL